METIDDLRRRITSITNELSDIDDALVLLDAAHKEALTDAYNQGNEDGFEEAASNE